MTSVRDREEETKQVKKYTPKNNVKTSSDWKMILHHLKYTVLLLNNKAAMECCQLNIIYC